MDAVYISDWAKYCASKNLTITNNYFAFLAPGAYKDSLVYFSREERFSVRKTLISPEGKNTDQEKKKKMQKTK